MELTPFTLPLAQSGYDVTGIDISTTAIQIAKKKAGAARISIDFLAVGFIELPFIDGYSVSFGAWVASTTLKPTNAPSSSTAFTGP